MISEFTVPILPFREWKYLDAHLIWIYEGVPQDRSRSKVTNFFYTAWYLCEGEVVFGVGAQKLVVPAGQWVLVPPGESVRRFRAGSTILSISFEARWISGQRLFSSSHAVAFPVEVSSGWLRLIHPMLQRVQQKHPSALNRLPSEVTDYETYAELQWRFQGWLAKLWDAVRLQREEYFMPQGEDKRAMEMRLRLDAQPLQRPFRLSELSQEFGLSPSQLNRIFFAAFGTTPKRYFDQRRLSFVKANLSTSDQQIKEIGFGAGFRYQSEFSSWFKKQTGRTPGEFRRVG